MAAGGAETADDLVKGTVAADAQDHVELGGPLCGGLRGVAPRGGHVDRYVEAAAIQDGDNIGKNVIGPLLARAGIHQ